MTDIETSFFFETFHGLGDALEPNMDSHIGLVGSPSDRLVRSAEQMLRNAIEDNLYLGGLVRECAAMGSKPKSQSAT